MFYLYIKALHIIFIVSWFAGLFYLPRLYVNLAMAEHDSEYNRLLLMSRKLYRFMLPLAVLALASGLWLWLGFGIDGGWLHAKLALIIALIVYHWYCGRVYQNFAIHHNERSHTWFRIFNEIPTVILFLVVVLVVVKPF